MAGSEVKEVVFVAIGAILISAVLVFFSSGIRMRNEFADTRNKQLQTVVNTKEYREFNKYNGLNHSASCKSDLSGWEVLAAIREYAGSEEIEIYVDKDKNNVELVVTSDLVRNNPGTYEIGNLQARFSTDNKYHPMVIYDGVKPKSVTAVQNKDYTSKVTGIKFTKVN